MNSSDATVDPKAIDRLIADYSRDVATLTARIASDVDGLHRIAGDRMIRHGRRESWQLRDVEAIATARRLIAASEVDLAYRSGAARVLDSYDGRTADVARLHRLIDQLEDVHRAHGWARFFIVTGGHIHRSMTCSTCNNGRHLTQFGWLPELSGETEAEAVAAHGALLCTVCYPSAPVEWTNGRELEEAAKQAGKCPGSGTYKYDSQAKTTRKGFYSGNGAVCTECQQFVTTTSIGKLRSHKPQQ